jgi:biopolymer transport protein ExbD
MNSRVGGNGDSQTVTLMIVPMIDVIFMLLLFFVINVSFEAASRIHVQLPSPDQSQAGPDQQTANVVINCEYAQSASGSPTAVYRIAADPPEPLEAIGARLRAMKEGREIASVVIRADRRLPFQEVRRVMALLADEGIPVMKVAVLFEPGLAKGS